MGVTAAYIREAIMALSLESLNEEEKYSAIIVPEKRDTTERWEPHVDKFLWSPVVEGTLRIDAPIRP